MFLYPSFQVMVAYRLSHGLWCIGLHFIARLIMQIARILTGIEIHPAAKIGPGFFVDHGMGTVIGQTSEIGRDVTLYHDVTLGGVMPAIDSQKQRNAKRHPTLGDYVIIGAGAQILGPITVSRCARVGGNSVVTRDVPEGATGGLCGECVVSAFPDETGSCPDIPPQLCGRSTGTTPSTACLGCASVTSFYGITTPEECEILATNLDQDADVVANCQRECFDFYACATNADCPGTLPFCDIDCELFFPINVICTPGQ